MAMKSIVVQPQRATHTVVWFLHFFPWFPKGHNPFLPIGLPTICDWRLPHGGAEQVVGAV